MEDQKSIGNLEKCPICNGKLFNIGEEYPRLGCEKCKRVWVYTKDGMWASEARAVRIIKEPEIGDSPDDFLEPIN